MGVFLSKKTWKIDIFFVFLLCKKIKYMKNYGLTLKRADMMKAGAYDGRFREKLVTDKKKKEKKEWARKKFTFDFKNFK
jgi:hypothetical protein